MKITPTSIDDFVAQKLSQPDQNWQKEEITYVGIVEYRVFQYFRPPPPIHAYFFPFLRGKGSLDLGFLEITS